MKKYFLYIISAMAIVATSCHYDYLTDGGVHDPHVDKTTYDYLDQHSWAVFDTLILLIDHTNMKAEVNASGTIMAVTDYSFKKLMKNTSWTIDSLKKYVTADTLRNYLFEQRILWDDVTVAPTTFTSKSNHKFTFKKIEQTSGTYSEWTAQPVYFLYFTRTLNGPFAPSDYCQTTNIQTTTGVIHAMSNIHTFNFGITN